MEFIVISESPASLLGAQACQKMDLMLFQLQNIKAPIYQETTVEPLTEDHVREHFSDVFGESLGCLDGDIHLEQDLSVTPVQMPLRQFPVAVQGQFRAELDRLENIDVLEKVTNPSNGFQAWLSKRNGRVRCSSVLIPSC